MFSMDRLSYLKLLHSGTRTVALQILKSCLSCVQVTFFSSSKRCYLLSQAFSLRTRAAVVNHTHSLANCNSHSHDRKVSFKVLFTLFKHHLLCLIQLPKSLSLSFSLSSLTFFKLTLSLSSLHPFSTPTSSLKKKHEM